MTTCTTARDRDRGSFHMIGAISQYGKIGLTVIGNRHDQVDRIYDYAIAVLDRGPPPTAVAARQLRFETEPMEDALPAGRR